MTIRPSAKPLTALCILDALVSVAILAAVVWWYPAYLVYGVAAVVALSLLLLPRFLRMRSTSITIADGRLHYESGLLSKTTRTMEIHKVQDVRVDQTFGQRILGMGDLTFETAGETSRITIKGIDNPRRAADHILQLSRGRSATA